MDDSREILFEKRSSATVRPPPSKTYRARPGHRGRVISIPALCSAATDARSAKPRLETDLLRAIEQRELTLFYQPQFHVDDGRVCGVEVLARWFLPGGAVIDPCVFIPLAEQTNLIGALGAWVLREACQSDSSWQTNETESIPLCVNVSPLQINAEFPGVVQRALDVTGFPANRLELEITESELIGNGDVILDCFRQLKTMGVRIAIDDFGSGYSSLSYLSRLPVDRLKLDKSLVHNLTTHWRDVAILRAIIGLGTELGVAVIAEGVETEQQFQVLKQLGCAQVQGYLFASPAPQKEALLMAARRWGARQTLPLESNCALREYLHAS